MKLSVVFWILTAAFVVITLIAGVFFFRSGGETSPLTVFAPCAVALVCSNLAVRARNEGK